ncbi:hypothetical protein NESM_000663300 [Novymonas esmeraldas]|uniref:Uncharacterized protein n=1 Tax=Novymonas esmeraldas TaxID=1808958 RepID=A0AAW0EVT3_9TRYP
MRRAVQHISIGCARYGSRSVGVLHMRAAALAAPPPSLSLATRPRSSRVDADPLGADSDGWSNPANTRQQQSISTGPASGFTELVMQTPGSGAEDAFGHADPLKAVEHTVTATQTTTATTTTACATDRGTPQAADVRTADAAETAGRNSDVAMELDRVASSRNRRRNRRKRSADAILGDVLHDALLLRDMGEKPTTDFIYKRTQERLYEEEYGRKPPSAKENAAKFIPFPPDFNLHRLMPLFADRGDDSTAAAAAAASSSSSSSADPTLDDAACRPVTPPPVYTKNFMNTHSVAAPDPWPERAVTPANPVWTRRDVEADKAKTGGRGLLEWEERMYGPRPGYDLHGEFLDAMDELGHWEVQLLHFLRVVPLSQRRTLPYLHEWYRLLVHRVIRAERRYLCIRDAAVAHVKASSSLFQRTEQPIDAVRSYYAEAHRSLASANYDPLRMKKSALAPLMRMTDEEFAEWQQVQRQRRNSLAAEFA